MRRRQCLAAFIQAHSAQILLEWDRHAATLAHDGPALDPAALRDHAADILQQLADATQAATPMPGLAGATAGEVRFTAAQLHAEARRLQGFTADGIVSEYRALRGNILERWREDGDRPGPGATDELARFDDAIDQAIAESISRYVQQTKTSTDLFIGILGHDIRNPLGTIFACAEYLLQSRQVSPAAAAPLMNAARRIRGIVDQTLEFARAQSHGVFPVTRSPGDLGSHLAKVVIETQIRHPDRELRMEVDGQLAGSWDEHRLAQVLSNLLGNAIAYGSREGTITVRVWSTATEARFSVHNHGAPIAEAERARIFQPLVRGNAAIVERRARAGLGLGLYISREIVRSHGGTVEVESSAEAGTTFTVRLPLAAR